MKNIARSACNFIKEKVFKNSSFLLIVDFSLAVLVISLVGCALLYFGYDFNEEVALVIWFIVYFNEKIESIKKDK